jgi:hypothetical protein
MQTDVVKLVSLMVLDNVQRLVPQHTPKDHLFLKCMSWIYVQYHQTNKFNNIGLHKYEIGIQLDCKIFGFLCFQNPKDDRYEKSLKLPKG